MEKTNQKNFTFQNVNTSKCKINDADSYLFTETLLDNYAVKDQLQTSAGFP